MSESGDENIPEEARVDSTLEVDDDGTLRHTDSTGDLEGSILYHLGLLEVCLIVGYGDLFIGTFLQPLPLSTHP